MNQYWIDQQKKSYYPISGSYQRFLVSLAWTLISIHLMSLLIDFPDLGQFVWHFVSILFVYEHQSVSRIDYWSYIYDTDFLDPLPQHHYILI